MKVKVEYHLQLLKHELKRNFLDLTETELLKLKMTNNPFCLNKDILFEDLQENVLKMKCYFTAKNNFKVMSLTDFRAKNYAHTQEGR